MSEEVEQSEGTWSGLKKTIIGVAGTLVTAAGVWLSTLLGGGDKAEPAPQQAAPVINITNSQTQQQSAGGGKTVIIKEKSATPAQPAPKVKKKEGDEFKEEAPKW
jgi:flagellar basal body-associated protein FliL